MSRSVSGDGRTIEARGSSYGVNEFPAEDRFNYAGVIPEMAGAADQPDRCRSPRMTRSTPAPHPTAVVDTDADGLSDAFEKSPA